MNKTILPLALAACAILNLTACNKPQKAEIAPEAAAAAASPAPSDSVPAPAAADEATASAPATQETPPTRGDPGKQ